MGKTINFIICMLVLVSLVTAINYEYRYNPYTGKRDRTIKLNQSGDNLTADNFFGNLFGLANNSDKLDGIDSTQFLRSDINDTLEAYYLYPNGTNPVLLNHLVNKEFVELAVAGLELDYFFTNATSDISGYFVLNNTQRSFNQTIVESASLSSGDNQLIFNFSTEAGLPFIFLSEGIYDAHIHLDKTGGAAQTVIPRWTLSKRNSTGEFLIMDSETSFKEITTTGQVFDLHSVFSEDEFIVDTDRLVFKLFVDITGGGSSTVRLYVEGTTDSHFTFRTPSSVLQEIFIRRDGTNQLTGNWNVGGYNITNVGLSAEDVDRDLPTDCPANNAVYAYGDNTSTWFCRDSWVNIDGDDATGNYTFGTNVLVIDDTNDKIGIGTTSPNTKLHIDSTGIGNEDLFTIENDYEATGLGPALKFIRAGSVLSRIRGIEEGGWDGGLVFEVFNIDDSSIGRDGATTEAMRIDKDGNVGIGTKTPTAKLDVRGDIVSNQTINGSLSAEDIDRDLPTNCSSGYAVTGWANNLSITYCRDFIEPSELIQNESVKVALIIDTYIPNNSTFDRAYTDIRVESIVNLTESDVEGFFSSGDGNITYSNGVYTLIKLNLEEFTHPGWITAAVAALDNFFTKTETDTLLADINNTIDTKLDITDQRYNDTDYTDTRVDSIDNHTATIDTTIGNESVKVTLIIDTYIPDNATSDRTYTDTRVESIDNHTATVDTDTQRKGDDIYLYNDSTTMILNETKLNDTVDDRVSVAGGGDITEVNTQDIYISGGETTGAVNLVFNETKLNMTTNASIDLRVIASFLQNLLDAIYADITYVDTRVDSIENVTQTADETNITLDGTVYRLLPLDLAEHFNSLNWITTTVSTLTNYFTKTDIINQDYPNSTQVNESITVHNASIKSYVDVQDSVLLTNGTDAYFGLLNVTTNLTITDGSTGFAGIWHNGSGICLSSC